MSLTWEKAKDTMLIGFCSGALLMMAKVTSSVNDIQKTMAIFQKDIAVLAIQTKYDYEERQEMKMRIAALEAVYRGN